ncbi:MAG: PAS domain S-box protein [Alphaproteobacteria bacterium]|uniref:histidine kinase n=1 Tax=Candidatus Nitrobium versatile TaxID=2884831 RepID=A0A953M042_9BACT|nr:PAS domain S-box protein [Candidatus Nitrobium versatile]
MKHMDNEKSKEELLREIGELRERVRDLEALEKEHQVAEEALMESEKRYRMLFESAGDAIFIMDLEHDPGRIVAANRAASEMHGYAIKELLSMNIRDLDSPEDAQKMIQRIRQIREGQRLKMEISHRKKDGTIFPVEVTAGLLEVEGHKFILAFDRDITERKKTEQELQKYQNQLEELIRERTARLSAANELLTQEIAERRRVEEALRKSESRYHTLAEISPVGIFYMDTGGNCIYVNERLRRIAGISLEEALGSGWTQLIHPDDRERVAAAWKRAIENRTLFKQEFRFLKPRGGTTWVLGQVAPEYNDAGGITGHVGTFTDITDRKQAETAERLAALGVVAARVAHDIRNPLVSIGGFAKRLEKRLSGSPQEYATIITKEVARLEDKLRDILGFARERKFEEREIDIPSLFAEVLEVYREELRQKNIDIVEDFRRPLRIMADAVSLREALTNLITNAIQAIGSSGKITLHAGIYDTRAVIVISDTGPGIREQDLPHIFNPFFTTKVYGTGLGLAITQRIIHEHHGTIEVQTKAGFGASFILSLPFRRNEP